MQDRTPRLAFVVVGLALAVSGCRDSEGAPASTTFVPSLEGSHGCIGTDLAFSGACAPCSAAIAPIATTVIGPSSQVAASAQDEVVWVTGLDGQVVEIDVTNPQAAVETELFGPGVIDGFLTALQATFPGVIADAELSGIAVLQRMPLQLAVVEQTNNTILLLEPGAGTPITLLAGEPNPTGGFADGFGSAPPFARFAFDRSIQIAATSDPSPRIVIPDPGNHALRILQDGFIETLVGTGAAFFGDGGLETSGFDTPVAVAVPCTGTILVAETGAAGFGGHRIRQVILGLESFFGQEGTVATKVGDGTPASVEGDGEMASVAMPNGLVSTSEEDVYWIDALTGVLRRVSGTMDASDCPLAADCATAVGARTFTAGGRQSLCETPGGQLVVLDWDGANGTLSVVTP